MPQRSRHFYEFDAFRLDADKHRLLRDGQPVHLSPKAVDALIVLVKNAGKLLERESLMRAVWADTFVEDANLTVTISHLRKALGQNGDSAEYIETIPRVGYRFVADVREVYEEPRPLIIERSTQSRTVIEEEFLPDQTTEPSITLTVKSALIPTALSFATQRKVLIGATALAIVAVGSYFYLRHGHQPTSAATNLEATGIRSIAVLPPKPLTNQSENASLSLGIADALITRLGSVNKFVVRPTSAIARYVDPNQDALTVGRALNVDAVLDGTLQRDHGRTRITLRLFNVSSGRQLWTDNFDEADSDIFRLQDSISQRVGNVLYSGLSRDERAQLTRQQTTNKEAYALYVQGNYFWNKRGTEAAKSVEYFQKAIDLDPNFAQAYVSLAAVDATRAGAPEAEALIDKALQLDPTSAEAHATLGFIKMFDRWDWSAAERELNRAIELNPNSSVAHHWLGVYLSIRGRLVEAKAEMHRALELDPLSLIIMTDIGQLHYFAHEYDQAAEYCNRVLTFDPEFHDAHVYLVDIYRMKGRDRDALSELIKSDSVSAEGATAWREVFAREGLRGIFMRQATDQNAIPLGIGRAYSRLGDKEQALKWLKLAVEKPQFFWTPYLNVDPIYDPLRNDARFNEILIRLGLA